MKRLLFLLLCLAVFATLAMAQNPVYNAGNGLHGYDILGAHQNNGRGCAGCHAPHSGGRGGGGNAATNAVAFLDPSSGDEALFGQDLTPLYGTTFHFGDNGAFTETLPSSSDTTTQTAELTGIAMCLACHDGNIAKGGMMVGTSYEQRMGMLPANLYGPNSIPTLLGNDGSTAGNYKNDHPVGVLANFGALQIDSYFTGTLKSNGALATLVPGGAYLNFITNYGAPAIAGTGWSYGVVNPAGNTTFSAPMLFITCTTCHNQHSMYIYQVPTPHPPYGPPIANFFGPTQPTSAVFPTYFFVNSPYNPGALTNGVITDNGKYQASTTAFCRQCHFDTSNENAGVNNVVTAY